VRFAAITQCVASQRVFIFVSLYFVITQSGNFWIHPRILIAISLVKVTTQVQHNTRKMVMFNNASSPKLHSDIVIQLEFECTQLSPRFVWAKFASFEVAILNTFSFNKHSSKSVLRCMKASCHRTSTNKKCYQF
jgi:hypothetical protein